jgi:AraC-like DNA-binding protein
MMQQYYLGFLKGIMSKASLPSLSIRHIVSAIRVQTPENSAMIKQNRPYWAITIKPSGQTKYNCNGIETISNQHNVVILPKGSSYSWKSNGGECLLIDFDCDLTMEELISFKVKDVSKIIDLFNKIQTLHVLKPPYYKMKAIQLLYKLLFVLLDSANDAYVPSQKSEKLMPAIEYIIQHYYDPDITGEFLSSLTQISYTYFRKIFAQTYGCPPMEYLAILRMKKAAELLKTDYSSIQAVSLSVGYNSVYHFSKMFKKHYNVSPTKYASNQQKSKK